MSTIALAAKGELMRLNPIRGLDFTTPSLVSLFSSLVKAFFVAPRTAPPLETPSPVFEQATLLQVFITPGVLKMEPSYMPLEKLVVHSMRQLRKELRALLVGNLL